MTYRMDRLARKMHAMRKRERDTLDSCYEDHPVKVTDLLQAAGDTYPSMPIRDCLKLMEREGFEPLFEDSVRMFTSFGFGRKSEGVAVVFTARDGALVDGEAEMNIGAHRNGFAFPFQRHVLFIEGDLSSTRGSRIRFDARRGLMLKLREIAATFPAQSPLWWTLDNHGERFSSDFHS